MILYKVNIQSSQNEVEVLTLTMLKNVERKFPFFGNCKLLNATKSFGKIKTLKLNFGITFFILEP